MTVHIGTSGWSYDHWQNIIYPPGLPPFQRLPYYWAHFQSVELNSSTYRWPADRTFAGWWRRLPEDFVMTVKAPRGLTHATRLYQPERWLTRICDGLGHLGSKMGVFLVQLPPTFECDMPRLAYFLDQLPAGLRVAVEFRHPSWHNEATLALLEQHQVAYCVMSGAYLPCILRATAPFVYVRMHGPDQHHLYAGSYADDNLRWWRDRICEWQSMGKDVFVYFNNDGCGYAVHNAKTLKWLLFLSEGQS